MKKILSFALMGVMVLSLPMMTACNGHKPVDLTIANFSNYEGLSVGYQNQVATASTFGATQATTDTFATKKKLKLLGKHKDGYYEQVAFEEESGSMISKTYQLAGMLDLGRFLAVGYQTNPERFFYGISTEEKFAYVFLIDKQTGKMFDITEYNFSFASSKYHATDDAIFISRNKNYKVLYKITIENNALKVEEILNVPNAFSYPIIADRYNNVYFKAQYELESTTTYMLTNQGQLKTLPKTKFAFNDIMYVGNQWVNANGELENATFVPNDMINLKFDSFGTNYGTQLIYQQNNEYYYRDVYTEYVVKYTVINDIEYNVERIELEYDNAQFGLFVGTKIYFQSATQITYCDIFTGKATTLVSDYFFNSIYTDNDGQVIFEAIDTNTNAVKGTIDPETDEIQIGVTPKQYEIFYVAALN